jgi:hypothetical protein
MSAIVATFALTVSVVLCAGIVYNASRSSRDYRRAK